MSSSSVPSCLSCSDACFNVNSSWALEVACNTLLCPCKQGARLCDDSCACNKQLCVRNRALKQSGESLLELTDRLCQQFDPQGFQALLIENSVKKVEALPTNALPPSQINVHIRSNFGCG